jgi:ABC-type multidrug transport system fused ATPase/permease subunit
MENSVDQNSVVILTQNLVKWWLLIRLETIGGLVSCFIAALAVAKPDFIPANYISLSLSNSFIIVSQMKWLVNVSADIEASMSSIERIKHYAENIDAEETDEMKAAYEEVPVNWPNNGTIVAKNLQMKYSNGPLVLKGLDFDIKPNEKIGIAGRTGMFITF